VKYIYNPGNVVFYEHPTTHLSSVVNGELSGLLAMLLIAAFSVCLQLLLTWLVGEMLYVGYILCVMQI
jgi:hypothetical protein